MATTDVVGYLAAGTPAPPQDEQADDGLTADQLAHALDSATPYPAAPPPASGATVRTVRPHAAGEDGTMHTRPATSPDAVHPGADGKPTAVRRDQIRRAIDDAFLTPAAPRPDGIRGLATPPHRHEHPAQRDGAGSCAYRDALQQLCAAADAARTLLGDPGHPTPSDVLEHPLLVDDVPVPVRDLIHRPKEKQ